MEMAATAAQSKKATDKSSVVKSSIFIVWLTVDFAVSVCSVESFKPRQRWATAIEEQTGEETATYEWMNEQTKDPIRNNSSCKRRNNNTELISITCLSMRHERSTTKSIVVVFDFTFSHLHLPHCQCQLLYFLHRIFRFSSHMLCDLSLALTLFPHQKCILPLSSPLSSSSAIPQPEPHFYLCCFFSIFNRQHIPHSLHLSLTWCIARFLPSFLRLSRFFVSFFSTHQNMCVISDVGKMKIS